MSSEEVPEAVSTVEVENLLVERVYDNLSAIYDLAFGPVLQAGRRRAVEVTGDTAGQKILEVGGGPVLNLAS